MTAQTLEPMAVMVLTEIITVQVLDPLVASVLSTATTKRTHEMGHPLYQKDSQEVQEANGVLVSPDLVRTVTLHVAVVSLILIVSKRAGMITELKILPIETPSPPQPHDSCKDSLHGSFHDVTTIRSIVLVTWHTTT